ncbi:uncharacterized protein EI90DRAFT_914036 [Cantharellus anzutake]|uniref:uncharacterized protein n=1 Tax=Cantharellus anzutake TaxID=1750568 RepID=UPI001902E780|nr:uncharacterized protein EI90DRAFT_914036 [Cantharellus anzutake]KAF8332026.1 hypothetical protein EI90DRAFT_914036 [Cantharellus anzutake]
MQGISLHKMMKACNCDFLFGKKGPIGVEQLVMLIIFPPRISHRLTLTCFPWLSGTLYVRRTSFRCSTRPESGPVNPSDRSLLLIIHLLKELLGRVSCSLFDFAGMPDKAFSEKALPGQFELLFWRWSQNRLDLRRVDGYQSFNKGEKRVFGLPSPGYRGSDSVSGCFIRILLILERILGL